MSITDTTRDESLLAQLTPANIQPALSNGTNLTSWSRKVASEVRFSDLVEACDWERKRRPRSVGVGPLPRGLRRARQPGADLSPGLARHPSRIGEPPCWNFGPLKLVQDPRTTFRGMHHRSRRSLRIVAHVARREATGTPTSDDKCPHHARDGRCSNTRLVRLTDCHFCGGPVGHGTRNCSDTSCTFVAKSPSLSWFMIPAGLFSRRYRLVVLWQMTLVCPS